MDCIGWEGGGGSLRSFLGACRGVFSFYVDGVFSGMREEGIDGFEGVAGFEVWSLGAFRGFEACRAVRGETPSPKPQAPKP